MRTILFSAILALAIVLYAQEESVEQTGEETTPREVVTDENANKKEVKTEEAKPEPAVEKKEEDTAKPTQDKINIAVLNLDNRGEFTEAEIKLFTDRVNSEIMDVDRFIVVERQQIDEILKEQGFQQSGVCSDQECLVEVGQLLSVQKVISGSFGKIENVYPVSLKIVDIQTGKVDAQVVQDFKGSKTKLLSECIPAITGELLRKAGYLDKGKKKKKLVAKPGFWIPTIAIIGGGAAAAILLTREKDDDGDGGGTIGEVDISNFPDHVIPVQ